MKTKLAFVAVLALLVTACDIGGINGLIDQFKAIAGGTQAEGVVVSLGADSMSVLVLQSGNSSYTVGAISDFTVTQDTTYAYVGGVAAGFVSLELGQAVKIAAVKDAPLKVNSLLLANTALHGTVEAIAPEMNQLTLNVVTTEGVDVVTIAGFGNPVTVRFANAIPANLSVGAQADVRGVFNRTAPDGFDAIDAGPPVTGQMEAANFGVASTNPLILTITGDGSGLGLANPATVNVVLGTSVQLVENDAGVNKTISATTLAAGILADKYASLHVEGSYDPATNTLTASTLRANVQ